MRRLLPLLALIAAMPARAEDPAEDWFNSKPAGEDGPAWTVECAATSVIRDGKLMPGSACAAVSPPSEAGGVLRLWTEVLDAGSAPLRGPAIAAEFPIAPERLAQLSARFTSNGAVLAAGATYHLTFHQAPAIEGRCDRLIMPARRAAADTAGPKALSFSRIGCQIADDGGLLRHLLLTEGGVGIALNIGDVYLGAGLVTGEGAEAGYAAAEARLRGRPEAESDAEPYIRPPRLQR